MQPQSKKMLTRTQRSILIKKMERAVEAKEKAAEEYLVTVSETFESGLTGADIAYITGNITESTVHKLRKQGDAIRDQHRSNGAG